MPTKKDVYLTSKPLGDPPVTELRPNSTSAQARLKSRAGTLIQRYAGKHWQQAQRCKWMIEIVAHIDRDYREYIVEQESKIQQQSEQILEMQAAYLDGATGEQAKMSNLEELARQQQSQLRDNAATIMDMQNRLHESENALALADEAAAGAAQQMAALHQAVANLAEHDTRTAKRLANRAYEMREALRVSQSNVRHASEAARRHNFEVAAMLRIKDEQLALEKGNMSNQFQSQIAAVHQVERANARMDLTKMQLELAAYKEPFMYQHGKACPTSDKELAAALGKKPNPSRVQRC